MLLFDGVRHDDEEELEVLGLSGHGQLSAVGIRAADVLQIVVVDGLLECFDAGLVREFDDVSVINVDI